MLADKSLQNELNKFAKYVIQQSRSNLSKSDKNVSKELYNSLGYNVEVTEKGAELGFSMEQYGEFQEKGVRGKSSSVKALIPLFNTKKLKLIQILCFWN